MRSTSTSVALRQARQHLLESGQCPIGLVDERLARSWQRSLDSGLLPTGRLGNPDEIAYAVGFFIPDEASWITGANLSANGGQYMGW